MKSAERFGISDTELATIITSVLIDRKIITKDATSEIGMLFVAKEISAEKMICH